MAIFTANLLCKTAIGLLYRPLLIPWVNNSSRIACTKGRDYSSSLPVRYIPMKLSEGIESVASSVPRKHFEDVEKHKQEVDGAQVLSDGEGRCKNFFLGEQEAVSSSYLGVELGTGENEIDDGSLPKDNCMEEPEELAEKLECNFRKSSDGMDRKQAGGNKQDMERLAIQLLATRAFTTMELRKRLQGKNFPLATVDAVIADFQNRGYINDCLYAETFSRSRWSSSCWGPKRIKQALFEKGISKVDAEEAIRLVFQEDESEEDHESVIGMSKVSMDQLLAQASKQWLRNHGVSREKRKSRLVQWLQYRGFNWSVTSFVLKKLESEYPP